MVGVRLLREGQSKKGPQILVRRLYRKLLPEKGAAIRETSSADDLILDFNPPELRGSKVLCQAQCWVPGEGGHSQVELPIIV